MKRHLPSEPEFSVIHEKVEIIRALNYYGAHATENDIRDWAESWCVKYGVTGSLNHRAPGELKSYACFFRMEERGLMLEDHEIERITKAFQDLTFKAPSVKPDAPKVVRKAPAPIGSPVITNLEIYLDKVVTGEITSARAPSLANSAKDVTEIREYCERELQRLIDEKEFHDRAVWKTLKNAYNGMLTSLDGMAAKIKTEKARVVTKRVKPPALIAKDVRYLKDFEGKRWIAPDRIVGAKKAYVFDTDARKLKVFIASGEGFTFTGTTLKNIDAEKCKSKTVRKPEILMGTPTNMSALNKLFSEIKTVETAANGRFNEHTIILSYS